VYFIFLGDGGAPNVAEQNHLLPIGCRHVQWRISCVKYLESSLLPVLVVAVMVVFV